MCAKSWPDKHSTLSSDVRLLSSSTGSDNIEGKVDLDLLLCMIMNNPVDDWSMAGKDKLQETGWLTLLAVAWKKREREKQTKEKPAKIYIRFHLIRKKIQHARFSTDANRGSSGNLKRCQFGGKRDVLEAHFQKTRVA